MTCKLLPETAIVLMPGVWQLAGVIVDDNRKLRWIDTNVGHGSMRGAYFHERPGDCPSGTICDGHHITMELFMEGCQ